MANGSRKSKSRLRSADASAASVARSPSNQVRLWFSSVAYNLLHTLRRVVPGLDDHSLFVDRFSVKFMERWLDGRPIPTSPVVIDWRELA